MTKATYKRRSFFGVYSSENDSASVTWGAKQQADRSGTGAVTEGLYLHQQVGAERKRERKRRRERGRRGGGRGRKGGRERAHVQREGEAHISPLTLCVESSVTPSCPPAQGPRLYSEHAQQADPAGTRPTFLG